VTTRNEDAHCYAHVLHFEFWIIDKGSMSVCSFEVDHQSVIKQASKSTRQRNFAAMFPGRFCISALTRGTRQEDDESTVDCLHEELPAAVELLLDFLPRWAYC
jgi:hypothetical protein